MKKNPKLSSLIDKAVFEYNLIEDGDRILIGASGGKDSTALIQYFSNRAKRPNSNIEIKALNIQNDFAPAFPQKILDLFSQWQVPYESINVNVLERIKPKQKMSCYWCSTQRRTELINYAIKNGYNKIALGHHMDDILETLLMNMVEKGELSCMAPKLQYENYPIAIIRPLCYVSEETLITAAEEGDYSGYTCTCNYQENSARKIARKKLEILTDGDQLKKERLFKSLRNVQPLYLP